MVTSGADWDSPDSETLQSGILYRILSFPLTARLAVEGRPSIAYARRALLFFQPVRHGTDFHGLMRDVQHRAVTPR